MKEPKFTKGPWEISRDSHLSIYIKVDQNKPNRTPGYLAEIRRFTSDVSQITANAHLIAAAPELFEALAEIMSRVSNDQDAKSWWTAEQEMCRAALAKALGEHHAQK